MTWRARMREDGRAGRLADAGVVVAEMLRVRRLAQRAHRLQAEGDYDAAREIATRAAEQARAAVGRLSTMSARRPGEPAQRLEQHHVDTFQAIATAKLVGELLLELADFSDAIPLLETSVRLSEALLAEDDMKTDGQAHREASLQLYLLGAAHEAMGDLGLADRYLSDALRLRQAVVTTAVDDLSKETRGALPGWIERRVRDAADAHEELAMIRLLLADVCLARDERERARVLLDQIRRAAATRWQRRRPDLAVGALLGDAALEQLGGHPEAAEGLLRRALDQGSQRGASRALQLKCLIRLAEVRYGLADVAEAEQLYRTAEQQATALYGREHPVVAEIMSSLATVLVAAGREREAGEALMAAIDAMQSALRSVLAVVSESQRLGYLQRARIDVESW